MRRLTTLAALALAAAASAQEGSAQEGEVRAVRATTLDFRPALRVLTSEGVSGEVVREGDFVVLRIAAEAPEGLSLPAVDPPLEGLGIERDGPRTLLRVKVAPEVPFEASYEPGMLTVVFGELPAPELRGPVTPELYMRLFPTPSSDTGPEGPAEGFGGEGPEGLRIGRATLRPYVSGAWVDADVVTGSSPQPVRDQYLQVGPGVTATMPVGDGLLSAEYEARLRFFSDIPEVGETSHLAGARLDVPIGSRTLLRVGHRYTRATLETTVVDPGREFFYDLSRFTYNESSALARVDLGARLWAEGEGRFAWNRFDEGQDSGFFDFDNRTLRAGLGYDIGSDLKATLSYAYEHMPPSPDREIVESTAHSVIGSVGGEIAALTSASVTLGLRSQDNPLASGESRSWTGITLGGSLRRELGHSSIAELQLVRASEPSGFDTNAFYLNNSAILSLTTSGPFQTWLRGGVGYLRNAYPNEAPGLGEARQDDIFGWSVGMGRELGWRGFVRADYRWERRDSNLPDFDLTTDGFVIQVGFGLFGSAPAQR
jgi:hypothetical protein